MTVQFKEWVCGRWLAGSAALNHAEGMDVLSLVSAVCCQVEVSVLGCHSSRGVLMSVAHRTACDHEALMMIRPWPIRGCRAMEEKNTAFTDG
jgi:hypothetical protein